jgi:hypothetical protein
MSVSPEIQSTFNYLFDTAAKALKSNRSFAPIASALMADGERTHSITDLRTLTSQPAEHIIALIDGLRTQVARGGVKAAGLVFDSATPPDIEGGSSAICVHAEIPGEAVQIFVAYSRDRAEEPVFGEPVLQDALARIFTA